MTINQCDLYKKLSSTLDFVLLLMPTHLSSGLEALYPKAGFYILCMRHKESENLFANGLILLFEFQPVKSKFLKVFFELAVLLFEYSIIMSNPIVVHFFISQ